jgi:hypothetical protein
MRPLHAAAGVVAADEEVGHRDRGQAEHDQLAQAALTEARLDHRRDRGIRRSNGAVAGTSRAGWPDERGPPTRRRLRPTTGDPRSTPWVLTVVSRKENRFLSGNGAEKSMLPAGVPAETGAGFCMSKA